MKRAVTKQIMADMKRYCGVLEDFNEDIYYISSETDESVIRELREFYNFVLNSAFPLPVNLNAWYRVNKTNAKCKCKDILHQEVMFLSNKIYPIFGSFNYELDNDLPNSENSCRLSVISTYCIGNQEIPVYSFDILYNKLKRITLTYYINHWEVSIESDNNKRLNFNFMDFFEKDGFIMSAENKGLPYYRKFKHFKSDKKNFTVRIEDNYKLYAFIHMLKYYLSH